MKLIKIVRRAFSRWPQREDAWVAAERLHRYVQQLPPDDGTQATDGFLTVLDTMRGTWRGNLFELLFVGTFVACDVAFGLVPLPSIGNVTCGRCTRIFRRRLIVRWFLWGFVFNPIDTSRELLMACPYCGHAAPIHNPDEQGR